MLYRVRQFFKAITAKVTEDDRRFVEKYLDESERKLFYSLPVHEQAHCLRVAGVVQENSGDYNSEDRRVLIRAALLHDIGKLSGGLNIITKSIMVLLNKGVPNLTKRMTKLKMVDTYYNHPEKAFFYIKDEGDRLSYLIRNHHNYSITGDEMLKLLQEADSKN